MISIIGNIVKQEDCTGCQACRNACLANAIEMVEKEDTFLYPAVLQERCIDCGQCIKACPAVEEVLFDRVEEPVCYAAWNKNTELVEKSSSGGVFSALSEKILNDNGYVYGAAWDDELQLSHKEIHQVEDLPQLRTSKYLQSNIQDSFKQVKSRLTQNNPALFVGTPCQVASLNTFLKKDYPNLITCDFICHGVPSQGIFRKYITDQETEKRMQIQSFSFREKKRDWQNYNIGIYYKNMDMEEIPFRENPYMKGFLYNLYLRPSCHRCKYSRIPRVADITLADYWGAWDVIPNEYNQRGTSAVLLNSSKGRELYQSISDLNSVQTALSSIAEGNSFLTSSAKPHANRDLFFRLLSQGKSFGSIIEKCIDPTTTMQQETYWRKRAKRLANSIRKRARKLKRAYVENIKFLYKPSRKNAPLSQRKILLMPPTVLNGGFGDDIMTVAFIEQHQNAEITLYLPEVKDREDLYGQYRNVHCLSFQELPKYHQYTDAYVLGADNMTGSYGLEDPLFKSNVLKVANRYGLKTGILGFSITESVAPEIKQAFIKLSSSTRFFFREIDSYERALQFLPEQAIRLVADVAFLCPFSDVDDKQYKQWITAQKEDKEGGKEEAEDRLLIGICPNSIQASKLGIDLYLQHFEELMQYINDKYKAAFVLLLHDTRPLCDGLSDKDLSRMLYKKCHQKLPLFYTDSITNGIQLKSYLQYIDFTLTGRMHLGISGYSLGKPMLGITYEGKFSGLQKFFHINPQDSLIDYHKINDSFDVIDRFIQNLETHKRNVSLHIDSVKNMSHLNFQ